MAIDVKIIADSVTSENIRITTYQLRYPRYIHADFMTHRVFSRNASSSRAKPVTTFLSEGIVFPIEYGSNITGMQAGTELTGWRRVAAKAVWHGMARLNGLGCQLLAKIGLHKQWANRPLEWFTKINVVVTSTEWDNFFALRCHKDAQPEIQALANAMYEARQQSVPVNLVEMEWHLPYITNKDWAQGAQSVSKYGTSEHGSYDARFINDPLTWLMIKVSVARCARVSYLSHDGKTTTVEQDLKLYDRLLSSVPLHASPAEHQATPDHKDSLVSDHIWLWPEYHGNLTGVVQYRKLLDGEYQSEFTRKYD